jgi:hypothetical protein
MKATDKTVRWCDDPGAPAPLRALLRATGDDLPSDGELAGLNRRMAQYLAKPAAPARWAISARVVVVGLVIVGIAAGIVGYVLHRAHAPSAEPPPAPIVTMALEVPAPPPVRVIVDEPAGPPPQIRAAPHVQPPAPPAQISEVALLEQARDALRAGDAARALELTAEHERQFADGVLAEEREALAIEALVTLGRGDDARTRWSKFASAYPHSNYHARLQRLMDPHEPGR